MGDETKVTNSKKSWSDMNPKEKKSGVIGLIVVALVVFGIVGSMTKDNKNNTQTAAQTTTSSDQASTSTPEAKVTAPSVPAEYTSALFQAGTYANTMHMSKQGVYDQLVSPYGGKFTAEASQYAIDHVTSDWNANALAKAKTYQNDMHLSPVDIRNQLVSVNGEKFTQSEADYAMQHLGD